MGNKLDHGIQKKGIILKDNRRSSLWNFYKKHSWKLGVLIIAVLLLGYLFRKIELNTNYVESYGKIYEVNRIVSGRRIGPLYKYKFWFVYNEKKYYGESTKKLKGNNNIGKIFKVKFLPNSPDKYEILFNQEYSSKYIINKKGIKKYIYFKKK